MRLRLVLQFALSLLGCLGSYAVFAINFSSITNVWERQNSYTGNRNVWDPTTYSNTSIDHNEVYQLDLAPYRLFTDRPEIWTMNYRCLHTNLADPLGWYRTFQQNYNDFTYGSSWCQRVEFNPYFKPASYYPNMNRWWTQATAATWFSTQLWNNGSPANFALIRFTENKTVHGSDNVLRRGAPPSLDYWGYSNWKMPDSNGITTSTNPTITSPTDNTLDGYYQGFITLSLLPINSSNNWGANSIAIDQGPVVWPRRGYRQWRGDLGYAPSQGAAWQQTSLGTRHPNAIVVGGYIYLFYLSDSGIDPSGNKDGLSSGGIFVARAAISGGTVGPFYCGSIFAIPCLPSGFSKATRSAFEASLSLQGSSSILPILSSASYPGITSFSVAKLAGTTPQKYVGVAEQYKNSTGKVKLFTSTDLVNWTLWSLALTYSGAWNQAGLIHYPRAINALDGNPDIVNPAQFYLVGGGGGPGCSSWHCSVNRITVTNFFQ